jgi:hypothetical protein
VHKALDQVGAFAGPLLVAAVAALSGHLWLGFVILAVPGALSLVLLAQLRRRGPHELSEPDPPPRPEGTRSPLPAGVEAQSPARPMLPPTFYVFAASCALSTFGLMTFGVISYHLVVAGLLSAAAVPVVYAVAMAVEAVAALGTGFAYDRVGAQVLYVLPVLVGLVPTLAFAGRLGLVLVGVAAWGLATGIQDSTVKALVSDLVPGRKLATAYGWFATFQGLAALVGGAAAGALYARHLTVLVAGVWVLEAASLGLLVVTLRRRAPASAP